MEEKQKKKEKRKKATANAISKDKPINNAPGNCGLMQRTMIVANNYEKGPAQAPNPDVVYND